MVHVQGGAETRRYILRATEAGSGDQPLGESPNVDLDRERRYAAISSEIGAGLKLGESGSGKVSGEYKPVTLTQVIAVATATVSVILIILGSYPFAFSIIIPRPFEYRNTPFPVCAPTTYRTPADCTLIPPGYPFSPGMVTPILVEKCFTNPFTIDETTTYIVRRRLVSDTSAVSISAPDIFIDARKGCEVARFNGHIIPLATPPGKYHWEGVSEVKSWRNENIPWRSESFTVM